ncbi:MAG: hypothetical protein JWO13_1665 [Acidobacteriales bacterium]|nr:hypothetical protein [Terriglobales bacterium]
MEQAVEIVCNSCRSNTPENSKFCRHCGNPVTPAPAPAVSQSVARFCPSCGAAVAGEKPFCAGCGVKVRELVPPLPTAVPFPPLPTVNAATGWKFAGLSSYYLNEFQQIENTRESYKGKWNWAAFLFGGFWALTKGIWLPVVICFVGSLFTGGLVGVAYCFIFGARGNYMYYCKAAQGKDVPI